MYAVIQTGGKQYNVSVGDVLRVEKLEQDIGSKVVFEALFVSEDGKIKVGADAKKVKVTAEVVAHGKADKIIVFRYRPKKRINKKNGHRQPFTEIKISEIK